MADAVIMVFKNNCPVNYGFGDQQKKIEIFFNLKPYKKILISIQDNP